MWAITAHVPTQKLVKLWTHIPRIPGPMQWLAHDGLEQLGSNAGAHLKRQYNKQQIQTKMLTVIDFRVNTALLTLKRC